MAIEPDSVERITADILIAAMTSTPKESDRKSLCDPEKIPQHYQQIFEAVNGAREKADQE